MNRDPGLNNRVGILFIVIILGAASAFSFLVPLVPLGLTRSWSTTCPKPFEACSPQAGGLLDAGIGSLSYRYLGIGGAWDSSLGGYEILQNGCSLHHPDTTIAVASPQNANVSLRVCYGDCPLTKNGLCASGPVIESYSRTGPISTFPASWTCHGGAISTTDAINEQKRNVTTINDLSGIVYPDLWNTTYTKMVSLTDVYIQITNSTVFADASHSYGWVTASWGFDSTDNEIHASFILTNGSLPAGYLNSSDDILNGKVTVEYQSQFVCT
jgi:hypothetical protein